MLDNSTLFATPLNNIRLEDCYFYHKFDYPDGEVVAGDWDLTGSVQDYIGNINVAGKRVLDVGTASGFMTFSMEQMGASCVSTDVESVKLYTLVPYFDDLSITDPAQWLNHKQGRYEMMKNSYWYSHAKFNSNATCYYGDLLNLPDELGMFDVAFVAQVMVHNRDPLGLLISAAKRTTDYLVISEGIEPNQDNRIVFLPQPSKGIRPHSWYRFSEGALTEFLYALGFTVESISRRLYRCCVLNKDSEITTIVARRVKQ